MTHDDVSRILEAVTGAVRVRIKVVPGASRSRIAGVLGDRLKLQVAAPPEGGKANKAVLELLGALFDVPAAQLAIVAGHTQARKTIEITGLTTCQATETLRACLQP